MKSPTVLNWVLDLELGPPSLLPSHQVHFVDVQNGPNPIKGNHQSQSQRHLRRSHGQHEEDNHLSPDRLEIIRIRNKSNIRGIENQLNRKEDHDDVPSNQDPRYANDEEGKR